VEVGGMLGVGSRAAEAIGVGRIPTPTGERIAGGCCT
jgi:hypothetical protein